MAIGALQLCTSSVRVSLQRLTEGLNKIVLPFQEGTLTVPSMVAIGHRLPSGREWRFWYSFAVFPTDLAML